MMRIAVCWLLCATSTTAAAAAATTTASEGRDSTYLDRVRRCADLLIEHGTDRYGSARSPIFVSILDVETRDCPPDPLPLDEAWRVTRRERRNPAGANLLTDQPLLRTLDLLSSATGDERYARAARACAEHHLRRLVDEKGFIWWGWHRHYDVFRDVKTGHAGNHHEIHAIHAIDWPRLWAADPRAVRREIEAIWEWHVIDKTTGETNRHGDGQRGCDFSMSAGSFIEAFAFLHRTTKEKVWLERALLIADYYWERRNRTTDLFPERPNAGTDRFDGGAFVTAVAGPYCHALLRAYEWTKVESFRDRAVAVLVAYDRLGYDPEARKYRGALSLDGSPIPGPRVVGGYGQYEPRGHLDLWEPYAAGYQFPIYTAQAYVHAYQLTGDERLLRAARRFADWIEREPPSSGCMRETWYRGYAEDYAPHGAHAGKYGRTISFLLHLWVVTREPTWLERARRLTDEAIAKLHHRGLFRGHPAKPYYEAMDGVGYLLYALLELDVVLRDPDATLAAGEIRVGPAGERMALDNW